MVYTFLFGFLAGTILVSTEFRTAQARTVEEDIRAACFAPNATADQVKQRIQELMNNVMMDDYTWSVDVTPTASASTGSQNNFTWSVEEIPTASVSNGSQPAWIYNYRADCNGNRIGIHRVRRPPAGVEENIRAACFAPGTTPAKIQQRIQERVRTWRVDVTPLAPGSTGSQNKYTWHIETTPKASASNGSQPGESAMDYKYNYMAECNENRIRMYWN